MSLRIWTVAITVAGLGLYTLSLLPETQSMPAEFTSPAEHIIAPGTPGTTIFPLIYKDPEPIEFSPYDEDVELEPDHEPTIPLPEHDRCDLCFQAYPIIPSVFQEVFS